MTYLIALLIFFSIFGFCGGLLGLYEIVKLKYAGTLLCRGQPVNGTKIELREDDTGKNFFNYIYILLDSFY